MDTQVPDARDGLVPATRVILSSLKRLVKTRGRHIKTGKLLSAVQESTPAISLSELYAMLLRLVRPWVCRYPLLQNQGHVGNIDGDPAAGMKYNEMGLTSLGEAMLDQEDPGAPMPSAFPHLLCNGAWVHTGNVVTQPTQDAVASGILPYEPEDYVPTETYEGGKVLSCVPPHNLEEITRALIHLLGHPRASLGDIMEFVLGPDFPTGGTLYSDGSITELYETGRGALVVRSIATVEETQKGGKLIAISEIPYGVTKTRVLEEIVGQVKSGQMNEIKDVRDLSSYNGMRLELEVRIGCDAQVLLQTLMRHPPLEHPIDFEMTVRRGGSGRPVSLLDLMKAFLEHRREVLGLASGSRGDSVLTKDLKRWLEASDRRRTQIMGI